MNNFCKWLRRFSFVNTFFASQCVVKLQPSGLCVLVSTLIHWSGLGCLIHCTGIVWHIPRKSSVNKVWFIYKLFAQFTSDKTTPAAEQNKGWDSKTVHLCDYTHVNGSQTIYNKKGRNLELNDSVSPHSISDNPWVRLDVQINWTSHDKVFPLTHWITS